MKIMRFSYDKTSNGPKVKAKDEIITSTWNLVDRSLTSAKINPLSGIVPSTVDIEYSVDIDLIPIELGSFNVIIGDETLMVRSNMSDGYASIVASEQRSELCSMIGTLERDNMRLGGMLGVERQRVDRLRRSISYAQRDL
nr:hypothetical protein [Tanacetum cinerariifolium]